MQIFVVGYPSELGGADTELWHVLKLWRRRQWDVTLIPTWQCDPAWQDKCAQFGVKTANVRSPDQLAEVSGLRGGLVVSFCNGKFLKEAGRFRDLGCRIIWVGCMTWLFDVERSHYEEYGPFDAYVFQSEFQSTLLFRELADYGVRDEQCFLIRGALDVDEFPYVPRPHVAGTEFVIGRLARPDPSKWNAETWAALGEVRYSPRRARLMGWSDNVEGKLGPPPPWAEVLPPCAEKASDFLASLHCLISMNGGAAENWPRVGLEAMAAGVPVIADNQWGWREMIDHGETGFLANSAHEFGEFATRLASDETARQRIIANARDRLRQELADPDRILDEWQQLFAPLENGIQRSTANPPGRRILIGVLSSCSYDERRDRCRQSWIAEAQKYPSFDVVFLLGDSSRQEPERCGDVLYLPCPDDYESLPQKTRWFCKWALACNEFDYLFKCDDDTYVATRRLASTSFRDDYIGCDIGAYASGGAGYLLSRRAAEIVADELVESTGAEDLLVGKVLREAGISLTADARFGSWPRPDQVPRRDNRMITGHGWRDDEMLAIHDALGDAPTRRLRGRFCRIDEATLGWGELGLGGNRGHEVDGIDSVDLPAGLVTDGNVEILSAHAPSRITLFLPNPCSITGVLDGASWPNAERPTRLRVDGALIAELSGPHQRTAEISLCRGKHELVAECEGPITRRYPIWLLRPTRRAMPRIVMPTSDAYELAATTSLTLLSRYWPEHPPIDVVGYGKFPRAADPSRTRFIPVGRQSDVSWTSGLANYLRAHCKDEFVLLWLDDYALEGHPDQNRLRHALRILEADPTVASFHLTGMRLPSQENYVNGHDINDVVCYPQWAYSINLQAAYWRRASLLRLLDAVGSASAAEFELAASRYYNAHLASLEKHLSFRCHAETPLFLDADPQKHLWALPYHNLIRGGKLDERHSRFLEHEGLAELVDQLLAKQVGAAFSGDHHMLCEFRRLISGFRIRTIVETGTHFGHTTELLATLVANVVSIESDQRFFDQAHTRLQCHSSCRLIHGDSAEQLAKVLTSAESPMMLFLDSHGNSGTPLLAELAAVAGVKAKPVIVVHGMRVPGTNFGFNSYDGQDYRWEWIEPSIVRIFGPQGYRYFFNRQAAGAKRGAVYVVPR